MSEHASKKSAQDALEKEIKELNEKLKSTMVAPTEDLIGNYADTNGLGDGNLGHVEVARTLMTDFKPEFKMCDLAWHPDSEHVLTISQKGQLLVQNVMRGTKDFFIECDGFFMCCCYNLQGDIVGVAGLDNICEFYKPDADESGGENAEPFLTLEGHEGYVSAIKFISDTEVLTSSGDHTVMLWDINSTPSGGSDPKIGPKQVFYGHETDVNCLDVLAPANPDVFITGGGEAASGMVRLWDKRIGGANTKSRIYFESLVNCCKFMKSNENVFGCGMEDGKTKIVDLRFMKPLQTYLDGDEEHPIKRMDFSKSGKYMFTGNSDSWLVSYDVMQGTNLEFWTLESPNSASEITGLEVSPDGQALCACARDSIMKVFAGKSEPLNAANAAQNPA